MKTCIGCGEEFDPLESLMGEEGQCQECWEDECDQSWWVAILALFRLVECA
jgi:hypothetical protein